MNQMASVHGRHTFSGLLLLALANVRRERLRSVLILITIALATLLFLTSLGSLSGFQRPIADMLSSQNASHALIDFDTRVYSPQDIRDWWVGQNGVQSLTPLLPLVVTTGRPVFKGKQVGSYLKLTERPRMAMQQDLLVFLDGEQATHPRPGEIWLPSSVARSAGIQSGDTLEIPTSLGSRSFLVSGVVVDPQYSSGFLNPERAWLGPGELAMLYPAGAIHSYTLGIRLQRPAELDTIWNDFNDSVDGGFSGSYLSHDQIFGSYTFMVKITSAMVFTFAVLSLAVALFIISSTISGEIMSGYRTFGILKSLGYTPRNVVAVFQLQFLLLALVAVPVGIFGAYFATSLMIGLMLESIGTAGSQIAFLMPAGLTFLALTGLVVITAGLAGTKAGKIKPASSIRYGAPEETFLKGSIFSLQLAHFLPLALVIALKNLAMGRRRDIYDLISIVATAFVLLFSVNVYHSMVMTDKNLPFWGLDGADVTIKRDSSLFGLRYESLKTYLADDPHVRAVAGNDTIGATIPRSAEMSMKKLNGHVVDGSLDEIGYINLAGRNPQSEGEISLGVTLARDYGKDIGDEFKLVMFGRALDFTVTGIFQGTSNSGYWFRTPLQSVRRANPGFEPGTFIAVLEGGADRQEFMLDLEARLGQAVDVEPAEKLVEAQLGTIVRSMGMVLLFLSLIFMLVSAVSIFNSTVMGIHESKRQLGVFKAIGYTQTQVRMIIVAKSGILGLAAVASGAVVFWIAAGRIMNVLMFQMGMSEFPMLIDIPGSLAVVPIVIAIAMLSGWIPSGRVAKIKPRALIIE